MTKNLVLALVLFLLAPIAGASDVIGAWTGTWTKAGDPLPVVVMFARANDKIIGTFDSDALRVSGIPFKEVAVDGDKVNIVLSGDTSTTVFDGTIVDDHLNGAFVEGTLNGTFALTRATPQAPLAKRDVTFANGDVTLAGEIILPPTAGSHPAILFLHGSGAEGRWASRFIAQKFARAGFVALIYDKRGVGASTGDWKNSGFDELVGDAVAGIRHLAAQPEVDPARIGVYGHSQGGTIVPLVAERAKTLSFVIGSAASGVKPADLEKYSISNLIGITSLPESERIDAQRFILEIVAVAYEGKDRTTLDAMVTRFKGRSWYFDPPPPSDSYWVFSRRIASYRPLDHWRNVAAPVLLLYGANDERVPPFLSGNIIAATLKSNGKGKAMLKIFPHADHTFRVVPRTPPNGWPKSVPDYVDTMVNWARVQTN